MFKLLRFLLISAVVLVVASFGFRFLYPVPSNDAAPATTAVPASTETTLGRIVLPLVEQNLGRSGITRLQDGHSSFAARIQLADLAEQSIDARYYIWQKDLTGLLLLDALKRAADRGVRVRILLDDNGTPDLDPELAELDAHPNIEVRLFNPFMLRSPRMISYVLDFSRLNRRMHNKSFTVDGVATVVGGRNIGNIYFARDLEVNYFDLDVVALGEAARAVSEDFDLYWASPSSVPVSLVLPQQPAERSILERSVAKVLALPGGEPYASAVRDLPLKNELLDNARAFEWVEMDLVSDDPGKGLAKASEEDFMISRLLKLIERPDSEIMLVSAYFVPGDRLTDILSNWAREGLRVATLTNAQEATDVLPVHSGYRQYRDKLLDAGVEVHELKSDQVKPDLLQQFGLVGSENTSLHAKTFIIDRQYLFVGSFNFDPRSASLNTEMGFLVRSPDLAQELMGDFDSNLAARAYRVVYDDNGNMVWRETLADGSERLYVEEPNTSGMSRTLVRVMGWLPIQWML
ncbi:phospholipase D family protein [Ruegeria sediminis]|uniref:Phospholipase D n=1 Tax=Ruegeria sediminis TaxID=2583820 RepID=A0ABY2WUS4_9RHOB|nr:phospholipase D family protein [Ruegeria sediminis]TMV06356.1 phospholipase D family protein [Ruegeria sediminis]